MFKPLPSTATGILVGAIDNLSYEIIVSADLASKIAALTSLDWTYLEIRYGSLYEVVKVVGYVGLVLTVRRAQENTTPYRFPAGAVISYAWTLSAVRDIIKAENLDKLNITATGAAKYTAGNIHVDIAVINSIAYSDAVGYSPVELLPNEVFTGCKIVLCGQTAKGPFYLTSKIYPIEVIEGLDSSSLLIAAQLLTEPLEAVDSSASFLAGTLRALLQNYANWPVEAVDSSASFTAGTLLTLLITYSNYPVEAVDSSASFTAGTLLTLLITYSNYPPEAVDSSASFLAGTLT